MKTRVLVAAIAAVLLASAHSPADGPQPSQEAVCVLDLALMSHREAEAAEGHRALFRVDLDSRPGDAAGHTVYDCASPDAANRTLWLRKGEAAAEQPLR